jgi:hypothetical protein
MTTISETIIQPRTGSQCTTIDTKGAPACADEKGFGWTKDHAHQLSLGYVQNAGGSDQTDCLQEGQDHYWGWGGVQDGSEVLCMKPVKELCAINAWDGYNYAPETWETTPLSDTITDAKFPVNCNQSFGSKKVGLETPVFVQQCPVQCTYDSAKFTNVDQVQAWEQKYGKYKRDTSECKVTTYDDYRNCLGETRGDVLPTAPDDIYTKNYDEIMTNFCSQVSTNCGIEPQTVAVDKPEQRKKCSYLMSTGPEGQLCRQWLNSYGPYKTKKMSLVGNEYCRREENQNNWDCACYNRSTPGTPWYDSFTTVSSAVNSFSAGMSPACYYLPCADPTNYIVPEQVFKVPENSDGQGDATYGFTCVEDMCASVLNVSDAAYSELDHNSLFISCGEGIQPVRSAWYFIKSKPAVFWLFVVVGLLVFFIIALLIYRFVQHRKTGIQLQPKSYPQNPVSQPSESFPPENM